MGTFPQPLTLEFQRNYRFLWLLVRIEENPIESFSQLMNFVKPIYVSQMAKMFTPPEEQIDMDTIDLGPVQTVIPKRFKINPIHVTYLDDTAGSVVKFHRKWMDIIFSRGNVTDRSRVGGMTWEELHKVSLTGIFSNTTDFPLDTFYLNMANTIGIREIPTTLEIFPRIIPIAMKRMEYDKGGDALQNVIVTYARLPQIKMAKRLQYVVQASKAQSSQAQSQGGTADDIVNSSEGEASNGAGSAVNRRKSLNKT
jgi:hypothetical protein